MAAPRSVLRVGCVPYLNSKVLVYGLPRRGPDYTLEFHPPSVLARKLAAGELDLALASSIESFRHPEYRAVTDLGICGRGEMWSIQLFLRRALARARRLGLDPASETSNALLQIVLKEGLGLAPAYVTLPPGQDPALAPSDLDGFLKIGDAALAFREPGYEALDLVRLWDALTGKPFVFALWLARPGVDTRSFEKRLRAAWQEGLRQAEQLAATAGPAVGLSPARAEEYITRIVRYTIGPDEQAGLARFKEYLLRHGLLNPDAGQVS